MDNSGPMLKVRGIMIPTAHQASLSTDSNGNNLSRYGGIDERE